MKPHWSTQVWGNKCSWSFPTTCLFRKGDLFPDLSLSLFSWTECRMESWKWASLFSLTWPGSRSSAKLGKRVAWLQKLLLSPRHLDFTKSWARPDQSHKGCGAAWLNTWGCFASWDRLWNYIIHCVIVRSTLKPFWKRSFNTALNLGAPQLLRPGGLHVLDFECKMFNIWSIVHL